MTDSNDSRMVRLPVREMKDEPAPQRAGGVIQQAINVLERYAPQHGNPDDMESALASLRAAQEGDLPPLLTDKRIHEIVREAARGSALRPVGSTPTSVRIARAIESEVRLALAAAGGGVPPGWKLVPVEPTAEMWAAVNKLDDEMAAGGYDGKGCTIEQAWECLLASSPQPEAAPAVQWKPPPLTCPRSNRSDCALFGTRTGINSAKENDHG